MYSAGKERVDEGFVELLVLLFLTILNASALTSSVSHNAVMRPGVRRGGITEVTGRSDRVFDEFTVLN